MNGGYTMIDLSKYSFVELVTGVSIQGIYNKIANYSKPIILKGSVIQDSEYSVVIPSYTKFNNHVELQVVFHNIPTAVTVPVILRVYNNDSIKLIVIGGD